MMSQPEYKDALNTFFRLKHRYENTKRAVCPNCGTKSTDRKSNTFILEKHTYKAECPNRTSPCKMQIEIYNGNYASTHELLNQYRDVFEDIKQRILQLRMKYIFWYGTSIGNNVSDTTKEHKAFTEEFRKLMNKFIVAKQQYGEVVDQYQHTNFLDKERDAEMKSIQNSIADTYTKLRDAYPDLVLAYENDSESGYETLSAMIKDQITADETKETRDNILYAVRGMQNCKVVQLVGALDKLAYNVSGKEPSVRVFELGASYEEDASESGLSEEDEDSY